MNKKLASIFSRVLLASVLPFLITIAFIFLTVQYIIHSYVNTRIRETVDVSARFVTNKIIDTMSGITGLMNLTAKNLSEAAADSDNARTALERIIHSLMQSNQEIYCAWYVFAAGVADPGDTWYAKSFVQEKGLIREIPAVKELDDMNISFWHLIPFKEGKPWQDSGGFWDYGIGEGLKYIATICYPIIRDGKTIGTVGMDITYDKAFAFLNDMQVDGERGIILVTDAGVIVYARDSKASGGKFLDLDFRPKDRQALSQALQNREPLLREIRSPIFNTPSLATLGSINLPATNREIFLYLECPTNTLYRESRAISTALALICAAGTIILIAGAIFASRLIATPIRRITDATARIAHGNIGIGDENLDLGNSGILEVESLREAVKKMVQQLKERHELRLYAVQADFERKKAEEASREKTLFFANMSHEIRTPMNAIMGLTDLLLADPLSPVQRKRAGEIRSASNSLLTIVDDILDISRIESGKLSLVKSDFDFQAMLDNIASICGHLAEKKKLAFAIERHGKIPPVFRGDEVRIRQILLNLIGNAIKFTQHGSVTLDVSAEPPLLHFRVIDTGIGIKPEDLDGLFNAFRQVDAHRNRKVRGTGLGLSISKNLAEIMGGNLAVDSVYGKGSIFHVRLPLTPGSDDFQARRSTNVQTGIRYDARALVVDDNSVNLMVAAGLLKLYGLKSDTAPSGPEALKLIAENDYDIVFMDHMMPGMDGIDTTKAIRKLGGNAAKVPVVALTANVLSGVREHLTASGMDDYLAKPIQKELLGAILAKWLKPGGGPEAERDR